jgi:hypothetical protein
MQAATQPATIRSSQLATAFLARPDKRARRTQVYRSNLNYAPAQIFRQLCPTRECDWIPGWTCELLYTESGYAEDKCVFRTKAEGGLGPSVWVFTQYEPDTRVGVVRLIGEHLVQHLSIELDDDGDGSTACVWTVTFTALTAFGDGLVTAMPEQDDNFFQILKGLAGFLDETER